MPEIQPRYIKLAELFSNRLFRIPPYQRAYSWQAKHRSDLFSDIERSYSGKNDSDHFMATVVGLRREKRSIITDEYQVIDIVDGQQRITTLILLFKAIHKSLDRANNIERRVADDLKELLVKPDETSLLLLQTNHDSSGYFAHYIRSDAIPDDSLVSTLADRNLVNAMRECEGFVDSWKADGGGVVDLYGHLKNRLTFIFHEIGEEKLVYTVFEVLNNRGLSVSWFDRLKSMLMAVVFEAETGNNREIIGELHRLWSEMYHTMGIRLGLSNETLRFAATLYSDNVPNRLLGEGDSVELLRARGSEPRTVVETAQWLLDVTKAVDRVASMERRSHTVTRISQARLLASAIFLCSQDWVANERDRVLTRWERVTFRIYGLYRKDARTAVGSYIRLSWKILNKGLSPADVIREIDTIGSEYPIDGALNEIRTIDWYSTRREEVRYLFWRYEEFLSKRSGQRFTNEQWDRIWRSSVADTIEHILPQSSGHDHVHWLGNLLLLPPGLNSQLGAQAPKVKATSYRRTGLLIADDAASYSGKWSKLKILEREDRLIEWAKQEGGE